MEGPSFQDLFSNLINRLKDEGKVMSVSEHFSAARDVEDMFSFLWGLEAAHQALTPRPTKAQKSEAKAEKLRSEGNRCYQKKLLARALDLYNQSIIYAQHPQIIIEKQPNVTGNEREEDLIYECQSKGCRVSDNEQSHRSLALSYANRSAVLFELGQYEKCIGDIDRALLHGYPRILYSKLAERKAKCLLSLQRKNEAKCLIESSLKSLDDLALDEEKTKLSKGTLQLLLQNCQEVDEVDDVPPEFSETHTDTKIKLLFSFESPEPPQLARHNPSIPSLSSSVNLAFSPNQGRHLVANQDIKPGEVIAVEDAYSKVVLLESSLHTHCTDCLARCLTPLPCPDCSQVIFCSTACRMRALASYHGPECDVLASLAALDIGKNCVLACRIISQTTFSHLRNFVPGYLTDAVAKPPTSLGFDSVGKYVSSDYRTVYHLIGNKESRSVSDLFKRCAMAFIVVKLLEQSSKFFVDAVGASFTPSVGDIVLTGSTLFTHMMNLPCNAHSITELKVNINSYQESISTEIGCGAFGVLSLTNHSCNPTAARFSFGATVALRALRFIPAGSEVTDCYGEHYCISGAEGRTASLLQQYYFTCACEACQLHWPTYSDLSGQCRLKGVNCNLPLDSREGRCPKCSSGCTKTPTTEALNVNTDNCREMAKQFKHIKADYESAYKSVLSGSNSSENIKKICTFIEFIDRYVQHPCKVYFEAQETLKHCFERQGSHCLL